MVRNRIHLCQQGFSLIEVLVASLILFLTVTIMLTLYQGAILSSQKAEDSLESIPYIKQLQNNISEALEMHSDLSPIIQDGEIDDVSYTWSARVITKGRAAHPENPSLDQINGSARSVTTIIYLWEVQLTITYNGTDSEFTFWELTW